MSRQELDQIKSEAAASFAWWVQRIEAEASCTATAAARAEPGATPDDAHVRTPEGPDDYCTGCGELWPCSFQRGVAAARAEVARQAVTYGYQRGQADERYGRGYRPEIAVANFPDAQQPPEVREPEPRYVSLDDAGPGFLSRNPDYQGEPIIDAARPPEVDAEGEDFEAAVRQDSPYFRRLNPILKSMGFLVAADTISPQRVHEFEHALKNEWHSDCGWCAPAATEAERE